VGPSAESGQGLGAQPQDVQERLEGHGAHEAQALVIWNQELEADLPDGAAIVDVIAVVRCIDGDGEENLFEATPPEQVTQETVWFAMMHWSARSSEKALLGETEDQD
jgi:hypothetical protein